jgi:hypothetical protein
MKKQFDVAMCALILFLAMPSAVRSQFSFITNNGTITITGYTGSNSLIVVPNMTNGLPVTVIGAKAFFANTNDYYANYYMVTVLIPEGVTSIGDEAFEGAYQLASVTMPNTLRNLGGSVFF